MDTEKNTFNQKKIKKNERIIIGTTALAEVFGCNRKWIEQLTKDGVLEKEGKGTYDLLKCVNLYISHLKSRTGANNDSKSLENEKLKEETALKKAKREKAELELELAKGDLHTSKDVRMIYGGMVQTFRSKMLMLAPKVAPKVIGIDDVAIVKDIIEKDVYEALSELSVMDVKEVAKGVQDEEDN